MKLDWMRTQMWRHQSEAYDWASARPGSMLAMHMGTGKSCVAAALAAAPGVKRTLVVAPARVLQVWPGQFDRHVRAEWSPIVKVLDNDCGTIAERAKVAQDTLALGQVRSRGVVLVINYEAVWRPAFEKWLKASVARTGLWDLLVCDEIHKLKSPTSEVSKFFTQAGKMFRKRIGLTGTPMPQSPLDVFSQYRVLDPRIFGYLYTPFKQRYGVFNPRIPQMLVGYGNLDELNDKFYSIAYRAGKDVIELPEENFQHSFCQLGPEAAKVYKGLEKDFIAQVGEGKITAANAMVKMLRLQQVTGGTVSLDGEQIGTRGEEKEIDNSKASLLAEVLEDAGNEEPVVVFCRFHSDLKKIAKAASDAKRVCFELSGRMDQLKEWQGRTDGSVLAVQIQAGGIGVDLTRARYSIFYSLSFSLAEYEQALARTHRPGQTRPVTHIHLVAAGTVDEKIHRALEARAEVIRYVLDELTKERKTNANRAA